LLDGLERDRCIRRVRNADDGRSWRVCLTEKGRRLCAKLDQRHRVVMDLFREGGRNPSMRQKGCGLPGPDRLLN
jgi:DNA-binding MarR family transcriptional regulator